MTQIFSARLPVKVFKTLKMAGSPLFSVNFTKKGHDHVISKVSQTIN